MQYQSLLTDISTINQATQHVVSRSINQALTLRNWLIGAYIFEYEQQGVDRANYGSKLIDTLIADLKQRGFTGLARSNLKSFRQFALAYPQFADEAILSTLIQSSKLNLVVIGQPLAGQLTESPELSLELVFDGAGLHFPMLQSRISAQPRLDWQDASYYQHLLQRLSWTHLLEIVRIEDTLKRAFYELEAVKSNWSRRELKRQINSLLYERIGLSKDKDAVLSMAQQGQILENPETVLRDPYVLEFLNLEQRPSYSENDLETALISHLQEFMQELGRDFCFVERQFRIVVDGELYFLDLLFYHRSLQCLVAIDLKLGKFRHDYAGQMNFYLNYLKENVAYAHENPPVGIILCADRDTETVRYATAGLDNQLFVSRYLLALPSEAQLQQWLHEEQQRLMDLKATEGEKA
jgi:predicted nuclease of restriction endonuclease-like (RecB) superfamily